MIFGTDEIHALRVKLEEQRKSMPKEEADRAFKARVERGRQAIAAAKKNKPAEQDTNMPR